MNQQVSLDSNKNLIVRLSGELTPEEVDSTTERMISLLRTVEKVRVLMDVRNLTKVPPKAREAMVKRQLPASDKIAVVGASSMVRVLGTLVLKVIPNVKASRFFDNEEDALDWLKED
jgi:hypothetical protein